MQNLYIALFLLLQEVILFVELIKELDNNGFQVSKNNPHECYNALKDIIGTIEMAKVQILCP